MKRSRLSEEQIIGSLREHEAGAKTADLARQHGADVFRVTNNGQFDVVFDFADTGGIDDDRVDVRALGASFDTLDEILAATTDYPGSGSVINFGSGNFLYLYLAPKANLTADDFIFI